MKARLELLIGLGGYAVAVALAAIFSGSVLAPIFAVPVAIAAGLGMAEAHIRCR